MTTPRPTRPSIPNRREYGQASPGAGPAEEVPWSAVSERLVKARHYWLVTVGLRGIPHVVPVDALWYDDRLYFASSPRTATARNIVRDPHVVAHLEDTRAVVIVEGLAERSDAGLLPATVPQSYAEKYGLRLNPADPEMPFFGINPSVVWTWQASDIRKTAIRWLFD